MGQFVHDTLVPNSTVAAEGFVAVGAADLHTATSDASDSSYVKKTTAAGNTGMILGLTDPTALPAFAQLVGIRLKLRYNRPAPPTIPGLDFTLPGYETAGGEQYSFLAPSAPASITDVAGDVWTAKRDGNAWTMADLNGLKFWHRHTSDQGNADGSRCRAYQLGVEVLINRAPTATPTFPTGVVTTTTRPVYTGTLSDPDGDTIERLRIKLFSGSGAVGDPETEVARLLWDSGEMFTSSFSSHGPYVLAASASYVWAAKAADAGSNGSYGGWTQQGFSTNITPPPIPTASTSTDVDTASIDVLPVAGSGGASTEFFRLERSDDSGVTFSPVIGATEVQRGNVSDNDSSVETSVGNWIVLAGASSPLVRSNAQAFAGSWSLLMTATGGGNPAIIILNTAISVTPGTVYEFKARLRAATSSGSVTLVVGWYDANLLPVHSDTSASVTVPSGGWTTLTQEFRAPLDALFYQILLVWTAPAAASGHYVDLVEVNPRIRDYFVPRLARADVTNPIRYRLAAGHVLALDPGPPVTITEYVLGPWLALTPTPVVNDCRTWLKHPYDPSLNTVVNDDPDLESSSNEDMAVHGAAGRSDWAVFRGTVRLEQGKVGLQVVGDAAWVIFEALRQAQVPVLLQTVYGDTVLEQMWIVLGPERSLIRVSTSEKNRRSYRKVTVGFTQVAQPSA
jgi:hypothetical protein